MPGIEDRIADLERRLKQAKALKQQQVARGRAGGGQKAPALRGHPPQDSGRRGHPRQGRAR